MNPIIKYLESENERAVPKEFYDSTILPIVNDKEVQQYLDAVTQPCLMPHAHVTDFIPAMTHAIIAALSLGYMYGSEGNKTPEEIATQLLKDLKIKEG